LGGDQSFSPKEQIIIDALRRSMIELKFATIEDISEKLSRFDPESMPGLVSHIKGIVHEMEFVAFENEDGDSVFAALHSGTNHPGYDVKMIDENTNESWEIQLKATDDKGYVQDWIAQHPDGEIVSSSCNSIIPSIKSFMLVFKPSLDNPDEGKSIFSAISLVTTISPSGCCAIQS